MKNWMVLPVMCCVLAATACAQVVEPDVAERDGVSSAGQGLKARGGNAQRLCEVLAQGSARVATGGEGGELPEPRKERAAGFVAQQERALARIEEHRCGQGDPHGLGLASRGGQRIGKALCMGAAPLRDRTFRAAR